MRQPPRDLKDISQIVSTLIELVQGRSNATGKVTLTANQATTAVTATNCAEGSTPTLTPTTAHAAAEVAAGGMYVSAVANGSFTITHANNAQVDRIFLWAAFG